MPISKNEIVAMLQENAALCNLEAEVIVALKAYQYNEQDILQHQLNQIVACLENVDAVRQQYSKGDK
jgi:hypothetical protein